MGAIHNELRKVGNLLRAFQNGFELDSDAGLERLGETLTPIFNAWALPEWNYLRGERLVGAAVTNGAVVGERSGAAILNPTGSGTLIVIEHAYCNCGANEAFFLCRATQAQITGTYARAPGGGVEYLRDTRFSLPGANEAAGQLYLGADPAQVGLLISRVSVLANTTVFLPGTPFVLSPGHGVAIEGATANVANGTGFVWREQPLIRSAR